MNGAVLRQRLGEEMDQESEHARVVECAARNSTRDAGEGVGLVSLVREVRREMHSLLQAAPNTERALWRLVEARAKRTRNTVKDPAQRDVLEGIVWAGVAEHFDAMKRWREDWEMWVLRRATARIQRCWMSITNLSTADRIGFDRFAMGSSVLFKGYYVGTVALLRFAGAARRLDLEVLAASEEEDVLHGIDCWIIRADGARMAAQVKAARRDHEGYARILGERSSFGERNGAHRAFEYLREIGGGMKLLGVYVDPYEGGAYHAIDQVDVLTQALRRALFN